MEEAQPLGVHLLVEIIDAGRIAAWPREAETSFVGKDRLYNRRFVQMCSHYLVDLVACTPASGWEKGISYVRSHHHPELTDQTIWEAFEAKRPKLIPYAGRFDGFHAVPASVSKTCLVRFDNNKYSVAASAVGRPVEVHAYADRIVIRQDVRIVGEHPRSFGRGETVYDPWHYVPVLARKPGGLRNGAPFKDWVLPAAMERVRRRLAGVDDGNRTSSPRCSPTGCRRSEAACTEAIAQNVHSADDYLGCCLWDFHPLRARQTNSPPSFDLPPDCCRRGEAEGAVLHPRWRGCRLRRRRRRGVRRHAPPWQDARARPPGF
jgi:hypothetical protein